MGRRGDTKVHIGTKDCCRLCYFELRLACEWRQLSSQRIGAKLSAICIRLVPPEEVPAAARTVEDGHVFDDDARMVKGR